MNPNNPNDPQFNPEMPQQPGNYMPPNGQPEFDLGATSPGVAATPGKTMAILLGGVAVVGIAVYALFGGSEKAEVKDNNVDRSISTEREVSQVAPSEVTPPPPVAVPTLPPPPPPVLEPPPPPPPPPPVVPTAASAPITDNKTLMQRYKSTMLIKNGTESSAMDKADKKIHGFGGSDPNLAFSREYLADTTADQAEATVMGDMNYIIAQGKVIDAVLETAINTDLPGPLRAVVSHDVYAESGHQIMIPKGSRLIGSYNSSIERGQKRVYVIWARIIRPDGIDIKIDSPGIDQLGRAGVAGYVDNKYYEMFATSLLTSSVSIAMGIGADKALNENTTQTTTPDGNTTSSNGSAGSQAVLEGIHNFTDTSQNILKGILSQQPTITVDQGTRLKVFVNRDLILPPAVLEQTQFVQ